MNCLKTFSAPLACTAIAATGEIIIVVLWGGEVTASQGFISVPGCLPLICTGCGDSGTKPAHPGSQRTLVSIFYFILSIFCFILSPLPLIRAGVYQECGEVLVLETGFSQVESGPGYRVLGMQE